MPLPFEPESVESLRTRYPEAIKKIWIGREHMTDRPGLHRAHVFDFEDGTRLLISRDTILGEINIHISASWENDTPLSINEAHKDVLEHFKLLGGKGILYFIGVSPNQIPHWLVQQES